MLLQRGCSGISVGDVERLDVCQYLSKLIMIHHGSHYTSELDAEKLRQEGECRA